MALCGRRLDGYINYKIGQVRGILLGVYNQTIRHFNHNN
jgi:hypothetical protein